MEVDREIAVIQRNDLSKLDLTPYLRPVSVIFLLTLFIKALGFGEKVVLAYLEGVGPSMDGYAAASGFSFMLFVLVDDILAPVFLTCYVAKRIEQGEPAAIKLFHKTFWVTLGCLLLTMFALQVGIDSLIEIIAPGFESQQRLVTKQLLRWMLPGGVLLAMSALTYVTLNAHRQFAWPELARLAYKATLLLGITVTLPLMGMRGVGIVMFLAAAIQLAIQLVGIKRRPLVDMKERIVVDEGANPKNRSMLRLMFPLAIGAIAAQLSGLVDTNRGSTLPAGSLAALSYARKLVDLPVLLVPGLLGIVALPQFAKLAALRNLSKLTMTLAHLTRISLILFIPLTILFFSFSEQIVTLVFARGSFDESAIALTGPCLSYFSIGLVAFAIEILVLRAYYAILDMVTPIVVGLVFVTLNIVFTILLLPWLGILTIPIALTLQKTMKVIVLVIIFAIRHPGPWRIELLESSGRVALSGVGFAFILTISFHGMKNWFDNDLLTLAFAAGAASCVYLLALRLLGVLQFEAFQQREQGTGEGTPAS